MKITALNASSRSEFGITQKILEKTLSLFENSEIKTFFPYKDKLKPCSACNTCLKTGKCNIHDSMNTYINEIQESDLIILATPIYTNFMSSTLKMVLERLRPIQTGKYRLNQENHFSPITRINKKYRFLLISTCGFPEIDNFKALEAWFDGYISLYDNFENAGKIFLPAGIFADSESTPLQLFYEEIESQRAKIKDNQSLEIKKEWIAREKVMELMKQFNIFLE